VPVIVADPRGENEVGGVDMMLVGQDPERGELVFGRIVLKRKRISAWVGEMIRIMTAAIFGGAIVLSAAAQAREIRPAADGAQTAPAGLVQLAQADAPPPRRHVTGRLRITPNRDYWPEVYPRYYPGPNAVRVCNAHYVQDYRPSGTVIVPRVSCVWRPG
jgi:hypothetical protein